MNNELFKKKSIVAAYRSRMYSYILIFSCKTTINLHYVWVVPAVIFGIVLHNWLISIGGVGMIILVRKLKKSSLLLGLPINRLDSLPDITNDLEDEDVFLLKKYCSYIDVDFGKLRVRSDLWSSSISPSVTMIEEIYHLLCPPGFFSLWQKTPRVAEAMIAHEFGHILQRDVDLYAIFRKYMRFLLGQFIPYVLAATIALGIINVIAFRGVMGAFNDIKSSVFLCAANCVATRDMNDFLAEQDQASLAILAIACAIFFSIFVLFLCGILTVTFRMFNHRSEAVCDEISIVLTGNGSISAALRLPTFHAHEQWSFFIPTLDWRQSRVDRKLALLGIATPAEAT